jgi:hypothetical protein
MRSIQAQWPMPTTGLIDKVGSMLRLRMVAENLLSDCLNQKSSNLGFRKYGVHFPECEVIIT